MNFDLNINNYEKNELENMFGLFDNNYNLNDIELKENDLKNKIFLNQNIEEEVKQRTLKFLSEAKKVIIEELKKNTNELVNDITKLSSYFKPNYELKDVPVINNGGANFVQERENNYYTQSYPSEFFKGVINPLKKRTNRQFLNIDTRFRENYYSTQSTNFHFDLPIKFTSIITMQLMSIEIPMSFFTISKQLGNNFFKINIETTNETSVIIIPDGNYSSISIVEFLNNYMTTLGGSFAKLIFDINITNNTTGTGQMIVGILSPNNVFNFSLDFQSSINGIPDFSTPLPLKLGWIFGFRNSVYINNSTYISEGLVDLNGSRYLYLVIDDHNNSVNNSFYSAFTSSILNKNILGRISTQNVEKFTIFTQNNLEIVTNPRNYFGPVDIQKLNIQLLDEYGRIINLNNMDFSFCLTFQSIYDI